MNAPHQRPDTSAPSFKSAIDALLGHLADQLAAQTRSRLAETSTTERAAFSLGECAAKLGVSKRSVQNLIDSGMLRSVSAGTRVLVPASALSAFLAGEEVAR